MQLDEVRAQVEADHTGLGMGGPRRAAHPAPGWINYDALAGPAII
ncbi:hypothetical protein OHA72_37140 [Dactylosporangium sp. NBC_01737]|nr:hypothetical protein OHA72_37140 [Dactylosporangium sp. NBC_01737]